MSGKKVLKEFKKEMKDQSVEKRKVILVYVMLLTAVLVLVSAASVVFLSDPACAKTPDRISGLYPVSKGAYEVPVVKKNSMKLKKEDALPPAYRSDEQPWASNIRVKNQMKTGMCWAFSMTTAAEYSYAKEIWDDSGKILKDAETSPGHLGWFCYNRVNDPLGLTSGDKNHAYGNMSWYDGGNQLYGMQHLATWSGLALEGAYPNDFATLVNANINSNMQWNGTKNPYTDDEAYDDYITQQECIMYLSGTDKATMKNLIYKYGAVSTGLDFDSNDKYSDNASNPVNFYNYSRALTVNHAVTIVGWDDTYQKSNFRHKLPGKSQDESYALTTPKNDGAWIVQNSWGKDQGDNGFFYMSYDSYGATTDTLDDPKKESAHDVSAYDMQPADTYKYNFQHDGTANCEDSMGVGEEIKTVKGTSAANVFTNTTNEPISLEAVGFTTFNEGETAYTIKIYTDLKDPADPSSGTLKSTTDYKTYTCGAKTAVLKTPVYVGAGKTYSIVFEFKQDTCFGLERQVSEQSGASGINFDVETAPGQSFFKPAGLIPDITPGIIPGITPGIIPGITPGITPEIIPDIINGSWKDVYNTDKTKSVCFRIKGFANQTSVRIDEEQGKTDEEIKSAEEARKAEAARKEKERKMTEAKNARIKRAKAAKVKIKAKALKKKKVRLTWKRAAGVTGYEIYRSKKKKSGFKKIAVLKTNAVSWKSKKIKKGRKAFFKVRPFTVISGSKVYGKWSKTAKVKLKK